MGSLLFQNWNIKGKFSLFTTIVLLKWTNNAENSNIYFTNLYVAENLFFNIVWSNFYLFLCNIFKIVQQIIA